MTDKLGALGTIGFKREVTPGVAEPTVNIFLPAETFKLNLKPETIERAETVGTFGKLPAVAGKRTPEGKFEGYLDANQSYPLWWVLGGTIATTDLGGGAYRHVFSIGESPTSLTIEGNEVVDKKKQWGAKLSKLELECASGELAKMKFEWLAKGHTDNATLTSTPTYSPFHPLTFASAKVLIAGVEMQTVENVSLTIDANLEARHVLRQAFPEAVRRKDVPLIEGKIAFIDYSASEYLKLVNASTFRLQLMFIGELIEGTSYRRQVVIDLPACQYKPGSFETEVKTEVITTEADFEAKLDLVTSKVITVECQNTIANFGG